MFFKKLLQDKMSSLAKERQHMDKGSYCTAHLSSDSVDNMKWFRPATPEEVLHADKTEQAILNILQRKGTIFGKNCDLTYRIKRQGYKIAPESIITEAEGKFIPRVVNRSNADYATLLWRMIYRIQPSYVPIDWHLDYQSDYRWDSVLYSAKTVKVPKPGIDIGFPLMFGRLSHVVSLGQVYTATKKEPYAQEVICQLLDFMSINPPYFGLQWSSAEESALRAVNMVISLSSIKDWLLQQSYGKDALREISKYLYSVAEFLSTSSDNEDIASFGDFVSQCAVIVVSLCIEDVFDAVRPMQTAAMDALKKAVLTYVYEEGTNPDASTCLHAYTVEALLTAVHFSCFVREGAVSRDAIEKVWGVAFAQRLYMMCDVLYYIIKPNGNIPQLGDNPTLHFMKAYPVRTLQLYPYLYAASLFFEEPKWAFSEFRDREDAFCETALLFGRSGIEKIKSFPAGSVTGIPNKDFRDNGWFALRFQDNYCFVSAGGVGKSTQACYAHNDKLSYELCLQGEDIIVDPGSYTYYDLKERNTFRGTSYHNTIAVRNEEQNYLGNTAFSMKHQTHCKVLDFGADEQTFWFEGEHAGYKGAGFLHRRKIEFFKAEKKFTVKDVLIGRQIEVKWQSSAVVSPHFNILRLDVHGDQRMDIVEDRFYSEEYGIRVPTKRIFTSSLNYTIRLLR